MAATRLVHSQQEMRLDCSDFKTLLRAGELDDLTIRESRISGRMISLDTEVQLPQRLRDNLTTENLSMPVAFTTARVNDTALIEQLDGGGVHYAGATDQSWRLTLISWTAPALIFVGIWMLVLGKLGGRSGAGDLKSAQRETPAVVLSDDTLRAARRCASMENLQSLPRTRRCRGTLAVRSNCARHASARRELTRCWRRVSLWATV